MFDDFETLEDVDADDLFDEDEISSAVDSWGDEDIASSATAGKAQALLPPREMTECLGHEALEQQLLPLVANNKMPHAMLFCGPKGIGKATFAFRLARYLLSQPPQSAEDGLFGGEAIPAESPKSMDIDPQGQVFRQVLSGAHPDLLVIERAFDEKKGTHKGGVDVETVRKITPFLRRTASQGGWRVVIVDDADTMNRSSQNAILKILEEPPKKTLLILVVHREGAMIPTIRSRARSYHFHPPSAETFNNLVRRGAGGLSIQELETLALIAGGSIGRALTIAGEGGLEAVESVSGLLQSWPQWDWAQIHSLSDALARPGQEKSLEAFKTVFMWSIETILRAKARGEAPPAPLNSTAIDNMMRHYSLEDWIKICENVKDHFETAERGNLDKRHIVFGLFSCFPGERA